MNKSLISGFERNLHSKREKINPKIDYLQYKKIRWKMQAKRKENLTRLKNTRMRTVL